MQHRAASEGRIDRRCCQHSGLTRESQTHTKLGEILSTTPPRRRNHRVGVNVCLRVSSHPGVRSRTAVNREAIVCLKLPRICSAGDTSRRCSPAAAHEVPGILQAVARRATFILRQARFQAVACVALLAHGVFRGAHQIAQRLVQGIGHAHGTEFARAPAIRSRWTQIDPAKVRQKKSAQESRFFRGSYRLQ